MMRLGASTCQRSMPSACCSVFGTFAISTCTFASRSGLAARR
ncbi:hypothetical protein ACFPRL_11210 [Pseudoclavibacter helvolus]